MREKFKKVIKLPQIYIWWGEDWALENISICPSKWMLYYYIKLNGSTFTRLHLCCNFSKGGSGSFGLSNFISISHWLSFFVSVLLNYFGFLLKGYCYLCAEYILPILCHLSLVLPFVILSINAVSCIMRYNLPKTNYTKLKSTNQWIQHSCAPYNHHANQATEHIPPLSKVLPCYLPH